MTLILQLNSLTQNNRETECACWIIFFPFLLEMCLSGQTLAALALLCCIFSLSFWFFFWSLWCLQFYQRSFGSRPRPTFSQFICQVGSSWAWYIYIWCNSQYIAHNWSGLALTLICVWLSVCSTRLERVFLDLHPVKDSVCNCAVQILISYIYDVLIWWD